MRLVLGEHNKRDVFKILCKRPVAIKLLYQMMRIAESSHNRAVNFNKLTRDEIMEFLDVTEITLYNHLQFLIKEGVILRYSKGIYYVNQRLVDFVNPTQYSELQKMRFELGHINAEHKNKTRDLLP